MTVSLAREIAYDAFVEVMAKGQEPEAVLERFYTEFEKQLKRLDRNFIKEVVYGGLRWYSKIFWILQHTSKRDLRETSDQVQAALVLGTYQIYYMDRVPDRAAVNESVEYIRKKSQASACPFVNGILRQIARRAEYFAKPDKQTQQAEYLALQFAHPRWIVERWLPRFNFEKMSVMLAANNQPPPISIRLNLSKVDMKEAHLFQQRLLREERTHSDRRPIRSGLHLREFPNLGPGSLFAQGFYTFQDESSQLIGMLVDPQPGQTIVDACAGPGGKLSHIYELADPTCKLIAIERDADQFQRAQETMLRLGHERVEWIQSDFLKWNPQEKPDKILLDAPCSGLGVLRRHPEGKWQKRAELVSTMAGIQRPLVAKALECLKVGGELIYSVCSFENEETLDICRWVQDKYGDKVKVMSPLPRLPDYFKKFVTRDNLLLVYSGNQDEMDGFGAFVLKLEAPL